MACANRRSSASSSCPSLPHLTSPPSAPKGDILNMSPSMSSHSNSNVKLESPLSLSWDSDNTVNLSSITSIPCDATPTPKSPAELTKEIATLEVEILRLERYLLSLYRTAFEERLPALSTVSTDNFRFKSGSPSRGDRPLNNLKSHIDKGDVTHHVRTSPVHSRGIIDYQSCSASLHSSSTRNQRNAAFGRRSLADHLGASSLLNNLVTPDVLSEDIVRCISSIYCRLADHPQSHVGLFTSPTSSMSPSSIFSSQNRSGTWSPYCNEDVVVHHQLQRLKDESGPYDAMVEVLRICLDDDSFSYAAVMLKIFRSLVRRLEKVDPSKMKREQKLAFWINIHNALIMHAYLAYANHNRVKSASILKAAYNVGGQCINACIIQKLIFGIRSHYPEPWLQTLFSPGRKLNTGSIRHAYALEYSEPLVHFALCSGAYSDPAVRVYTAKNIFQELKIAQREFIQASVRIHKGTKMLLPKILSYFAKDMSIDTNGVLEVICGCLRESQEKVMGKCMKRHEKCIIHWLPQRSTFRYVIHGDLAKLPHQSFFLYQL